MSITKNHPKKVNEGRNVKRFREMLSIKQEVLAYELGGEWSQKMISVLEAKEKIEDDILAEIAKVLKIPEEAIRNFDEGSNVGAGPGSVETIYNDFSVNPIEKWVETLEELKASQAENVKLYERLLQSEKEKVEFKNDSHREYSAYSSKVYNLKAKSHMLELGVEKTNISIRQGLNF